MLKKIKNTVIFLVARAMMALVRCFCFWGSLAIGRFLGRAAFRLAGRPRHDALAALELAFPEKTPQERWNLAREVFIHFGMGVAEWVNIRKLPSVESYMELEPRSRQVLEEVLSRGKGTVWVTGHCGNWELMALSMAKNGFPTYTIGKKSYDPRFTRLIQRFRDQGPVHTVWRGEPRVVEKMVEVLRRKAMMGLLIDQDTKVPGVFVPFFGKLAFTPNAAAMLARSTGAPIVVGFNYRRPTGGYWIVIEEFEQSTLDDQQEAITVDTAGLTAKIEQHIRTHPREWVWMHRRWKTRPPEEQKGDAS